MPLLKFWWLVTWHTLLHLYSFILYKSQKVSVGPSKTHYLTSSTPSSGHHDLRHHHHLSAVSIKGGCCCHILLFSFLALLSSSSSSQSNLKNPQFNLTLTTTTTDLPNLSLLNRLLFIAKTRPLWENVIYFKNRECGLASSSFYLRLTRSVKEGRGFSDVKDYRSELVTWRIQGGDLMWWRSGKCHGRDRHRSKQNNGGPISD